MSALLRMDRLADEGGELAAELAAGLPLSLQVGQLPLQAIVGREIGGSSRRSSSLATTCGPRLAATVMSSMGPESWYSRSGSWGYRPAMLRRAAVCW